MEKKVVKSPYGVWITVYEVKYEGRILWFDEKAVKDAERRFVYRVSQGKDEDELAWTFKGTE